MKASIYKNRIIEFEKNKDFLQAYELITAALDEYPFDPFFLKGEIYILFKLGRLKEARQKAEINLDLFKQDTFFLRTYLNILASLKNTKKDIEDLIDKILSWGIMDEDLLVFITRLTRKISGSPKGLDVLKQAASIMPESEALKKMLDEDRKESGFESKFALYKKKFSGKSINDAIDEIEIIRAIPEYANDYELNLYLAGLYKEAGRFDKAIDLYKKLLLLKDNDFARKMLGYAFYKKGDMSNALIYLKDIFLKNPFDHYLYRTIFKICEGLNNYQELEDIFKKALLLSPNARHLYGLIKKAEKWQKK